VTTLRFNLLGGFEARLASGEALRLKGRKTRALLVYLALRPDHRCSRDELVGLLWGDRGEAQARSSLRQSLSELRRALGEANKALLVTGRDAVSLDGAAVAVDAAAFERSVDDGAPAALERAAALYRGDLLDGLGVSDPAFEAWLRDERRRLRDRACDAFAGLLDHEMAAAPERALATARRLLALDPLREAAHRAAMRLHAGRGERTLALKQYRACRDLLAAELGVPPEPETEALAAEIRSGAGGTGGAVAPGPEPTQAGAAVRPPHKPAIAVLPFANLSGDPEQDYFSDGITEDIITELARFGSLQVVARSSTFAYRDRAVNVGEAGKVLGARYLLEGSLRKAGDRIRLTAQLVDVETGKHVWAERYDRVLADIFAIQDELVHAIVSTLAGRLEAADIEQTLRKRPDNLAAYDYYLQALQHERHYDFEGYVEGRKLLQRAVALDPTFARALALLSYYTFAEAWFEDPDDDGASEKALEMAQSAIRLDPDDGDCYAKLGVVHTQRREFDKAAYYLEQALALNPHDAQTWSHYAWYLTCVGEHRKALDFLDRREAIEPFPPNWHWEIRGLAAYCLGRYRDALDAFGRMTALNYWAHGYLAACHGQLGNVAEAKASWRRMKELRPGATLATFAKFELDPLQCRANVDRWLEGLRKAGIAE